MSASNRIFLVVDAGRPVAVTARHERKGFLQRRREALTNPPVYTFWGSQGPSIMTMSSAV